MKAIKRFLGTTNKIQLKRFLFLSGLVAIFLISLIFYNLIFSNFFYNCGNGEQCFKRFSDEPHPAASSSLTVAGGIVPFDEQASEITEEFFKNLNNYSGIKTIVLISPDSHNQTALTESHFIIGSNFDGQNNDLLNITTTFRQNPLVRVSDLSITLEEGVSNLSPLVKKYFPQVAVVSILVSPLATKQEIRQIVEELNTFDSAHLVLIGSTNFSQDLPDNLLLLHQVKSLRTLINFEEKEFPNLDVDCWQVLYAVRYFSLLKRMEHAQLVIPTVSSTITSYPASKVIIEESTPKSFCSLIFSVGKTETQVSQSALLVGDIMMARGVDKYTQQYGLEYPFIKIKKMFKGVDIVYGNLEGPVMENALSVSLKSVNFAYPVEVVGLLKDLGFTVLNLANNHMKDKGSAALLETRKHLEEYGLFSLGDYQSCEARYSYQNGRILFIGAHLVYNNITCVNEIIEQVKQIKKQDPNIYIIVTPHWGNEYTHLANTFQKTTAHSLIDAGVDAIIGHHPHVVQSIEEYQGKPIFYSLGNFVFDMYFSKEVQEELAVGLKLTPNEVVFYLIPIKSRQSQLEFMDQNESRKFLAWLGAISSPNWQNLIERGIITLKVGD